MLDKTLYVVDNTEMALQLLQSVLSLFLKVGKSLAAPSVDTVFPSSTET